MCAKDKDALASLHLRSQQPQAESAEGAEEAAALPPLQHDQEQWSAQLSQVHLMVAKARADAVAKVGRPEGGNVSSAGGTATSGTADEASTQALQQAVLRGMVMANNAIADAETGAAGAGSGTEGD